MQSPKEIAEQLWRDLNYEGRREYVCGIIAVALQSYGDARATAERERCEQVCLDLYDRGPGREIHGWTQAWGSGVLDAADAIKS